jgi:hypothetical protein
MHKLALIKTERTELREVNKMFIRHRRTRKKLDYRMKSHLIFKRGKIYEIQRTWLRKYSKKSVKTVVAQGVSKRALGAMAFATEPGIMRERIKQR